MIRIYLRSLLFLEIDDYVFRAVMRDYYGRYVSYKVCMINSITILKERP